jgi:uncharacterized RDD family membrane protein YckC
MENNWHYTENQQMKGPISHDQLRVLLDSGQLPNNTLVWKPGMANWCPASDILELWQKTTVENALPPAEDESEVIKLRILPKYEAPEQTTAPCPQPAPVWTAPSVGDCDYAGIGRRFLAILLDEIIIFALVFPVASLILQFCSVSANFFVAAVLLFLYSGFFLSRYGATPGKMVLGLRIMRSNGGQVSFLRGGFRFLPIHCGNVLVYVSCLMVLLDEKKRALHDRICDTVVLKLN